MKIPLLFCTYEERGEVFISLPKETDVVEMYRLDDFNESYIFLD
jgi:hypothetical protein